MQRMAVMIALALAVAACRNQDREDGKATEATPTSDAAAPTTKPEAPSLPTQPSIGIVECDEYVALLDRYVGCDKIEQRSKDAASAGLEKVRGEWESIARMPPAAREATITQCASSVKALQIALENAGC